MCIVFCSLPAHLKSAWPNSSGHSGLPVVAQSGQLLDFPPGGHTVTRLAAGLSVSAAGSGGQRSGEAARDTVWKHQTEVYVGSRQQECDFLCCLSVSGCEFVTRRGRSCNLKQSWEWTLHSDAFLLRKLVSKQYREPFSLFWRPGKAGYKHCRTLHFNFSPTALQRVRLNIEGGSGFFFSQTRKEPELGK